ncbi:MAG: hypothetical protein H3C34_01080 [Caldilineaceae bacterium]|nr:hypothetical protein [Caldilineaceae bacterium]
MPTKKHTSSLMFALVFVIAVSIPLYAQSGDTVDPGGTGETANVFLPLVTISEKQATIPPPPEATPTPTPLASPPATPTPTPPPVQTEPPGFDIEPYSGAPECSSHNDIAWHGLWDGERGCHYDHEHGANPASLDVLFGPWAADWGGQQISYPWQTFKDHDGQRTMENDAKHGGYKVWSGWLPAGGKRDLNWQPEGLNWIAAVRYEHHSKGLGDPLVRHHSAYAQYLVCTSFPHTWNDVAANCGFVSGGGWNDYGVLHCDYKDHFCAGSNEVWQGQDVNGDPYRAIDLCSSMEPKLYWEGESDVKGKGARLWDSSASGDTFQLWTTGPNNTGWNKHVGLFTNTYDRSSCAIEQSGTTTEHLIDDLAGQRTRFNNTEQLPFTLWVWVNPNWDGGALDEDGVKNGRVTMNAFTDLTGELVPGCTAAGPECIPYRLDHVPVGWASWNVPTENGKVLPNGIQWNCPVGQCTFGLEDRDINSVPDWWIDPEVN